MGIPIYFHGSRIFLFPPFVILIHREAHLRNSSPYSDEKTALIRYKALTGAAVRCPRLRPDLSTTFPKRPKDLAHVVQDMMANLSSDRGKQVARNDAAAGTQQAAQTAMNLLASRQLAFAERQMTLDERKYEDLVAKNAL